VSKADEASARRRTAYHESGHALMARALGLTVNAVWISKNGDGKAEIGPSAHLACEDRLALCFAGYAAEELSGVPAREFWGTDLVKAVNAVLKADDDDDVQKQVWAVGEAKARQFVLRFRLQLARLAEEIEQEGRVEGARVALLLGEATSAAIPNACP
jgi:hypothetical protein